MNTFFRNNIIVQFIQVLSSGVTLLIFLSGYPSLSSLIQGQTAISSQTQTIGTLTSDGRILTGLVLLGVPLYVMLNTWLAISTGKFFAYGLTYLGIDCHHLHDTVSRVNYFIGGALVLPMILGFHIIFVYTIFRDVSTWLSLLVGALSLFLTIVFYVYWFKKWNFRSNY